MTKKKEKTPEPTPFDGPNHLNLPKVIMPDVFMLYWFYYHAGITKDTPLCL